MRILKAALPVLALVAGLGHANAQIVTWTYTGTATGTDNLGYFGPVGTVLTDGNVTVVITTDTTKGFLDSSQAPTSYLLQGGTLPSFNTSTNPITASVTINGVTHSNWGSLLYTDFSEAIGNDDVAGTFVSQLIDSTSCDCAASTNIGITMSDSWSSNISLTPDTAPSSLPDFISGAIYGPTTDIEFTLNSVTVVASTTGNGGNGGNGGDGGDGGMPAGGAPEPQTWAILLAGFAGVGTMVRYAARKGLALGRA